MNDPGSRAEHRDEGDLELSIVVPLYNEEESVGALHAEIQSAGRDLATSYEVIFVDDGSRDGTFARLRQIAASDPAVRLIRFRRNYGQTAAMQAGFDHARGRVVVTMDGDLQNDPRDIGKLVREVQSGYDIVCGWRKDRKDKLVSRKIPSRIANRLIGWITGIAIHDNGCSLKAYRADVVRRTKLYSEMHRFIPAIMSLSGSRVKEVVVHHRARRFGTSKYGISRTFKVLSDLVVVKMITGCMTSPGRWFGALSLPFLLLSCGSLAVAALRYREADGITAYPVIFPAVALLFSFAFLHLMLLGMIAELVVWAGDYRETKSVIAAEIEEARG